MWLHPRDADLLQRDDRGRDGVLLLLRDNGDAAAVEFAIALPVCLTLFFGGFVLMQTVALSRKITLTTRALADLTSQYTSMQTSDMTNVMGGAIEVLAPFASTPLGIWISEIITSTNGLTATVTGLQRFCLCLRKKWSGRRESNPRMKLGKLPFCH